MKDNYKVFLKLGLVAYLIVEVISILKVFDISGIESITKLNAISIPITTLILIVYASDKGDNNLCKVGFLLLVISIVCRVLTLYEIVEYSYNSDNTVYKIVKTLQSASTSCLSLCGVIALFSIIPSTGGEALKGVTILSLFLYYAINVSGNFIDYSEMDWIDKAKSILYIVANMAEWSFVALYLIGKKDSSGDVEVASIPLQPQVPVMQQQYAQPVQQQVPQAMPQTSPPVQQNFILPTVQQPVINQVSNNNQQ